MGGILTQIMFLLYMLMTFINEKGSEQKIMNKVMKFKGKKQFNVDLLLNLFSQNVVHVNNNIAEFDKKICLITYKTIRLRLKKIDESSRNLINKNNVSFQSKSDQPADVSLYALNLNKSKISEMKVVNVNDNLILKKNEAKIVPTSGTVRNNEVFKLSSMDILISSACPCFCSKYKSGSELMEKGSNKINFYLDVLNYIKKNARS